MPEFSQINYQSTSMIPLFYQMAREILDASRKQLSNMKQVKGRAHVLNDELVNRIINLYTHQLKDVAIYLEQCKFWRKQKLSSSQLKQVNQIESNVQELEKINNQILFLVKHYKDGTIDKILAKDDIELVLDFLLGKIDTPFDIPQPNTVKRSDDNQSYSHLLKDYKENREIINHFDIFNLPKKDIDSIAVESAKKLHIFYNSKIIVRNEAESNVHVDYCAFYHLHKGKTPIKNYVHKNKSKFKGKEAKLLNVLLNSRFTILRIEKMFNDGAIKVYDLDQNKDHLMIDVGINHTIDPGDYIVCTALDLKDYVMTSGAAIPFKSGYPGGEKVLKIFKQYTKEKRIHLSFKTIVKYVAKIYSHCLTTGALTNHTVNDIF